ENFDKPKKALSIFKYGAKLAIIFNISLSILIFCVATIIPFEVEGVNFLLILMSIVPLVTILYELIQIYFRYNRLNRKFSYYTTTNTINILVFSVFGALIAQAKGLVLFRYAGYVITVLLGIVAFKFPHCKFNNVGELKKGEKRDLLKLSLISMVNNGTAQLIIILDI
ncbi:hypothetical protein NXY55_28000, partial [Aeromonas veronii]|nr:hypothetical protein [Aeromonas veronii]